MVFSVRTFELMNFLVD